MKPNSLRNPIKVTSSFCVICLTLGLAIYPVSGGDYTASFLEIGVGARALAMGGAFCGVKGDGSSFYWNPAGLAFVKRPTLSGMYGPHFGRISNPLGSYHFLGLSFPLPKNAVFAINWIRLSIRDIPIYSDLEGDSYWDRLHDTSLRPSGEPEGYLSDTEDAVCFSFAMKKHLEVDLGWEYHKISVELLTGVNLKWIHQSLGNGEASGMGIDLGMMIRFALDDFLPIETLGMLSWGMNLQDVTGTKLSWNTRHQDVRKVNFKWGFSYEHPLPGLSASLCLALDHNSRWGGSSHWGLEYMGFDLFRIRVGLNESKFTGGVGFKVWIMQMDYAFLTHELDALHRLSCSIAF